MGNFDTPPLATDNTSFVCTIVIDEHFEVSVSLSRLATILKRSEETAKLKAAVLTGA